MSEKPSFQARDQAPRQTHSPLPTWLKAANIAIFILALTALGIIVARDAGHPHPTSGAGEIWWASAPEVIEAYESLTSKLNEQ